MIDNVGSGCNLSFEGDPMKKSIWSQVLDEAARSARQAPRIFFAPFVGAVRETARVFREVQLENQRRTQSSAPTPRSNGIDPPATR